MRRAWLIGCLLVLAVGSCGLSASTLDIYFIDVGHGDAIIIDCGDWEALLDAGSGSQTASERVLCTLCDLVADGIVELAVLSHPHQDHHGGFTNVFAKYEVLEFWEADDTERADQHPTYTTFLEARSREEPGPEIVELVFGDRIFAGCLTWTILGPASPVSGAPDDHAINNNSLVLLLQYGLVSFLFPGDIESKSEAGLPGIELPCGNLVLKVPHHGSATSTSCCFLAWADPALAIVSGLEKDLDESVIGNLGRAGVPFLTTFGNGTICISTDGNAVWVTTRH